jgi:hypothetical protein
LISHETTRLYSKEKEKVRMRKEREARGGGRIGQDPQSTLVNGEFLCLRAKLENMF